MSNNAEYPELSPDSLDLDRANAARVYNYLLGGNLNWAIDRAFGERVLKNFPLLKNIARANYDFLRRAVRYCLAQGVSQFIDLGSGVPMVGNLHEVAERLQPASHCVYVDREPLVVSQFHMFLERHGYLTKHAAVNADLRDVDQVWQRVYRAGVLKRNEPVALIMGAVLHFVPPESDPGSVVSHYRELLPEGSYLIMSHATDDAVPSPEVHQIREVCAAYEKLNNPVYLRSHSEIAEFFQGFSLADPGLVWLPEWPKPLSAELSAGSNTWTHSAAILAENPARSCLLGGVARKV